MNATTLTPTTVMRHGSAPLLALPFLVACQMDVPQHGATDRAIINGTIDTDPAHDAVGALTDVDGNPFCTGTYVGNATVVTAAHCFDNGVPEFVYFGVDEVADNLDCLDGFQEACDQFFFVEDYLVHPSYSSAQFDAGNDIALIDIGFDPAVEPIPFLAFSERTELQESDEGTPVVFVGFGVTDGAAQTGAGLRRMATGELEALGPRDVDVGGDVLELADDQVLVMQPDSGTCQGDSGGPMLFERGGVEMLAAVTSFGDDGCMGYGVSITVDVHESFVRELYGDGDIPGEYEPDDGGDGGGGDDDDDGGNGGDGGDGDGGQADGDGDGGGCAASSRPSSTFPLVLGLLALLLGRRRNRAAVL